MYCHATLNIDVSHHTAFDLHITNSKYLYIRCHLHQENFLQQSNSYVTNVGQESNEERQQEDSCRVKEMPFTASRKTLIGPEIFNDLQIFVNHHIDETVIYNYLSMHLSTAHTLMTFHWSIAIFLHQSTT